MNASYREVTQWQRLLPKERDVLTGRPAGHRDDKGRREPPRSGASASKGLIVAGAVALLLTVGGVAARAMTATDDPTAPPTPPLVASASRTAASTEVTRPSGVVTQPSIDATPVSIEPPATAILLEYGGGRSIVHECTDITGGGACKYFDTKAFTLLAVRCTQRGCALQAFIDNRGGSLAGPLKISGQTRAATGNCKQTQWSLQLTPVGEAVTEGLRHPARLVGQLTQERPAERRGGDNCLGAREVYRYDATPS